MHCARTGTAVGQVVQREGEGLEAAAGGVVAHLVGLRVNNTQSKLAT